MAVNLEGPPSNTRSIPRADS